MWDKLEKKLNDFLPSRDDDTWNMITGNEVHCYLRSRNVNSHKEFESQPPKSL